MKDDSIEGIYDTLKQCALISKSAGGIGVAVSCIRATGSYIAGVSVQMVFPAEVNLQEMSIFQLPNQCCFYWVGLTQQSSSVVLPFSECSKAGFPWCFGFLMEVLPK